ncbi:MAG: GyrI-like domain-containing protein [Coriobacteriales bacterium]|jgi:hypothetical protein|nr:GyrI-like domain-containing protein [Coriobacteriales bacterium]
MAAIDFKKTDKALYQPPTAPVIIDVLPMTFIAIDGSGDPNTSESYAEAIEILYGLSYAIKMANKTVMEYVVPPLEGLWSTPDDSLENTAPLNKDQLEWTALIRQPDFVGETELAAAKQALAKKKPKLNLDWARLQTITEGLCVQVMHIGSYDDEPATIKQMLAFATDSGYLIDLNDERRHHEIYIADPRKTAPEKLRTVLRYPIKERE